MATKKKYMKVASTAAVLGATLGMASSAAQAQTNVTVFGQIALGLTKASGGALSLQTTGWGNGIGFKGSEDLGGGLSAVFHIENRFAADTGAAADPFWTEKAAVGLVGGFGKVELGRFANAYDAILGIADPFGETVANMPHENALGEVKWSNSIGYYTPAYGPVSAALTVTTKEAPNTRVGYALNVKYAFGPATVGLGYVRNGINQVQSVSLAGNYDFGPAKLYGGVTNSSNTGAGNARNYQIGVAVPVTPAGTVKAAYSNYKPDSNTNDRENKVGLGYWHTLSIRTMLYADVARTNLRTAGVDNNVNAFDVGILHKF